MKVVEALGAGRSRLFRIRRDHPFAAALDALFREEEERFEPVLDAVRTGYRPV